MGFNVFCSHLVILKIKFKLYTVAYNENLYFNVGENFEHALG